MNVPLLTELGRCLGVRFYKHATPTELISHGLIPLNTAQNASDWRPIELACRLRTGSSARSDMFIAPAVAANQALAGAAWNGIPDLPEFPGDISLARLSEG